MKKSPKWLLPVSLAVNIVLLLLIVGRFVLMPVVADKLSFAILNKSHAYYCEEHYNAMLEKAPSPETKMAYAMTVCLKNYKNGQDLNLQPLLDEVNNTEPKTNFSNTQ